MRPPGMIQTRVRAQTMKIKVKTWISKLFAKRKAKTLTGFPSLDKILKSWDDLFRDRENAKK